MGLSSCGKLKSCRRCFDSFGHRPNADFERYMNRHCVSWNFNAKQLQSVVSKFGGYYCIYFCILRSRDLDRLCVKLYVVSVVIVDLTMR